MVGCILFCYQSSRGCKLKQFIMGIVLLQELVELNLEDARVVVVCGVRIQVRVRKCCEDDCTDCWGVFGRVDSNGHACTGVGTRSREDVLATILLGSSAVRIQRVFEVPHPMVAADVVLSNTNNNLG